MLQHFTRGQILRVLGQFHRVLKPDGKVVILWPHARATSVAILKAAHWLINDVAKKPINCHPREVSLLRNKQLVEPLPREADFRLVNYSFRPRDFFVQTVVVDEKTELKQ